MKPMLMEHILDRQVKNLSGGELQRVALVLCLGHPADIYLIGMVIVYAESKSQLRVHREPTP